MKRKISHLVGSTLLCSILAINMLATPNISFAAQESDREGIVTLENNTLYKYDLNGDDKVDEIKVKQLTSGEGKTTLKLYINNKLCLTRKSDLDNFDVQVCDLDKNDNYLDLFICVDAADCIFDACFARYNGKALDSKVAFTPEKILKNMNARRYELVKLTGNGKFYILNDTPVNSDAIGNYHCYMPFQLKDNAIIAVPVKTYELNKFCSTYKYKAAKNFQAYEKAGSQKAVYTVKKGDKVTFDKLYISKSGKAYFRMINTNGKTGWIESDQKDLFVNARTWG